MLSLLIKSYQIFYRHWKQYLFFGVFYLFLSSYILIPFLGIFLQRLLLFMGTGVLLNSNAVSLLLDPRGMIGLILLSGFAVFFIFLEIGTLILLAHKHSRKEKVYVTDSMVTAITSIRGIVGMGGLVLSFFFLVMLPIINIPIMPGISGLIRVPEIFMETIMAARITQFLYFVTIGVFAYILLRSIFTLHIVILEDKKVFSSIKKSFVLSKGVNFKIVAKLIIFDLLLFVAGSIVFTLISLIPQWFNISVGYYLSRLLVTFSGLLTLSYVLMLLPLNVIFISQLYYEVNQSMKAAPSVSLSSLKILQRLESAIFRLIGGKRATIAFILTVTIIASFFMGFAVNQSTIYVGRDIKVISHRGVVEGEFENSLSAIRASLNTGVDMVEFDIQLTKDDVLVLNHDRTLRRTFGLDVSIGDLTYEEISSLDVKLPEEFHPEDSILPALDEALSLINRDTLILIDVKTHNDAEIMAEKIAEAIDEHDLLEHAYVQSFDRRFLRRIKEINPDIVTSQILYFSVGDITRLETDFLTIHHSLLSHDLVRRTRRADKGLLVWPVNREEDIHNALQYDIDGIITNDSLLVKEILGRETRPVNE